MINNFSHFGPRDPQVISYVEWLKQAKALQPDDDWDYPGYTDSLYRLYKKGHSPKDALEIYSFWDAQ